MKSTGPIQVIQSDKIKIGKRYGIEDANAGSTRMKMQMVCPMADMSPNAKTVVRRIVEHVMDSIQEKVRDEDIQGIVKKNKTWDSETARNLLRALLHYCNMCFYYRIMHYRLSNARILQLKNAMQTWNAYFVAKEVLPSKETLDGLKKKEQPTDEVPLRWKTRQHPDDSTDEDETASKRDDDTIEEEAI
jgi:hypothetical protein